MQGVGRRERSVGVRGIIRSVTSVVVATIMVGSLSLAALAQTPIDPEPNPRARSDPQALPGSDHRLTGIDTDRGRIKPAREGTGAIPSGRHGPDVPGERVEPRRQPAGRIVTPAAPSRADIRAIRDAIAADGWARVNVTVTPPPSLTAHAGKAEQAAVAESLDGLAQRVASRDARELSRIKVYPFATYRVTGAGLDRLVNDPAVTSVHLDGFATATLDVSTGVIDSDLLNAAGTLGDGWSGSPVGAQEVAIIDSGVDNDHAAFAGRVVAEACFSANSNCPNGGTSQTGANAGENCTHSTDCDHGTHVASIAAGASYTGGHEGVARGVRIIAVNVTSDGAGSLWTASLSDIIAGLQFVLDRRNAGANVVSANMSIGINGFAQEAVCDGNNASFAATQAVAQNLQNAGVAVVAAAGNNNLVGSSYPACLSSVFSISATDDLDVPASFTNSGTSTDWWAPGVSIDAAIPGTNTHTTKDGTSMASPHVAGAFGLLRECVDGNGVQISNATAVGRLNATGVNVTDNGATRKRINVLDAATGLVNNNDFASPETLPANPGAGFNDFDFNICSDTEPGEPGPFSLDNGIWYSWTPSATGIATISTDDGGGNVTTFDTTLAVYTGSTIGSLQVIASDDDGGVGVRSLVRAWVDQGITYRIKVDGFAAATGLLNLHLQNDPITCQGITPTLLGTRAGTTLNGTPGPDVIAAGPGNDTVLSGDGNDRVCGDEGEDFINAGIGDDIVFGGSGADEIHGVQGSDTLVGNPGGGSTDDVGDTINGGPGNDTIDGWTGDDLLQGGPNDDLLIGAAGIDTAQYVNATGSVTASLTTGTATGAVGNDTFSEVENLTGSPFADVLTGDANVNVISGGTGNDSIQGAGNNDIVSGGGGRDTVRGGNENDTVRGNGGNDRLVGNAGIDSCSGGAGTDTANTCETTTGVP
jgi:subtilisin family serine protease